MKEIIIKEKDKYGLYYIKRTYYIQKSEDMRKFIDELNLNGAIEQIVTEGNSTTYYFRDIAVEIIDHAEHCKENKDKTKYFDLINCEESKNLYKMFMKCSFILGIDMGLLFSLIIDYFFK